MILIPSSLRLREHQKGRMYKMVNKEKYYKILFLEPYIGIAFII